MKLDVQLNADTEESPKIGTGEESSVRRVFEAARAAQTAWASTPIHRRLRILRRVRRLIAGHATKLAVAASDGTTRPLSEVLVSQVLPLADACQFLEREAAYLLAPRNLRGDGQPAWLIGSEAEIQREPLGVVLIIAPSNYPLLLPGVQLLQALAAGNAVLLKPGLHGTAAARALIGLLQTADLDPRLVGLLPESVETAHAALELPIAKVFFTGSFATGARVLAQLAPRAIPAVVELSGSDAVIVRADADLDLVVNALLFGLRLNDSETCIAPRRVFVARRIAERLEARLESTVRTAGLWPGTVNPDVRHRLSALFTEALREGAHLLTGGVDERDNVSWPVIIAGAKPGMRLLQDEFFAPVLSLVTVEDDLEAVQMAAACPYALGAAIFSRDVRAARALAAQLPGGVAVINDLIVPTADPRVPFGGRRRSGYGVTRGAEGLLEMTAPKVVITRRGKSRPHFDPPQPGDEELFRAYIETAHGEGLLRRVSAAFRLIKALASKSRSSRN